MSLTVKIGEAKTRLSELLAKVEAGEEIVIARGNEPDRAAHPLPKRGAISPRSIAEVKRGLARQRRHKPTTSRNSRLARRRAAFLMALVVDASFAAAWFLPDEPTTRPTASMAELADEARPCAVAVLVRDAQSLSLARAARPAAAGRSGDDDGAAARFPILDEGTGNDRLVVGLAMSVMASHGYDASYLALALVAKACRSRRSTRKLAAAARAENVPVLGPLGAS